MKTIRLIAAGLLLLSGLLHVLQITTGAALDAALIITLTFGVIYLALGALLLRGGRVILWLAAVLPLIGLLLAGVGMFTKPTLLGAFFMLVDVAVSVACFYLIAKK